MWERAQPFPASAPPRRRLQSNPAARRQAVDRVMERHGMSQRRACRLVGLSRSMAQYRCKPRNEEALRLQREVP